MKFATKLVEIDAIIIKNNTTTVICKFSNLPMISVGFVNILSKSSNLRFKNASEPTTIKNAKNENINKFNNKLRLPFFKFCSSFTYLAKSPKLIIIIEKYAKIVPATVNKGAKLLISKKFLKFKTSIKAFEVTFTSLKKTTKKKIIIPR